MHSNLISKVIRVCLCLIINKIPKYVWESINKWKDHWRLFARILYSEFECVSVLLWNVEKLFFMMIILILQMTFSFFMNFYGWVVTKQYNVTLLPWINYFHITFGSNLMCNNTLKVRNSFVKVEFIAFYTLSHDKANEK